MIYDNLNNNKKDTYRIFNITDVKSPSPKKKR